MTMTERQQDPPPQPRGASNQPLKIYRGFSDREDAMGPVAVRPRLARDRPGHCAIASITAPRVLAGAIAAQVPLSWPERSWRTTSAAGSPTRPSISSSSKR
jgi:hypothetical protein